MRERDPTVVEVGMTRKCGDRNVDGTERQGETEVGRDRLRGTKMERGRDIRQRQEWRDGDGERRD